jgi:hypothetical protein
MFHHRTHMLCRVEEASRGIAVRPLPPSNRGTGLLAELPCCLGIEAKTVQSPLHVATLSLVKADLIFRLLSCFGVKADCAGRSSASLG